MKKILMMTCAGFLLGSMITGCDKVPVGAVGIKVNNLGSDKGVEEKQVLGTGWYWVGFTKTLYTFPTFMQTRKWEGNESFTFQTSDGMVIGAPISLSYSVDPDKVPVLFQTYRKGLDEITDTYIHNIIRDALVLSGSTMSVDQVYGPGKGKFLDDVQKFVTAKLSPMGIKIDQVSLIGHFELPQSVVQSINLKIQATQQAQQRENEVATATAEAAKAVAKAKGEADSRTIEAQAEAKANLIIAQSLTKELVSYQAIMKWNGALPTYQGGGAVPFINIGDVKN